MQVIWSMRARRHLDEIITYIGNENPDAALHMDDLLYKAAEGLRIFPRRGRLGRINGTYELVAHPNYILIYALHHEIIYIVDVLHAAQQYPPE
ncbi:MAG: type II toxin-antitoxin system RelE/ParE family toxin [Bacteroidaceae bacterium]|nr:type II toxin-antitoxin system RelE/ParE family toxin [Bacteroidaceae bacterium]